MSKLLCCGGKKRKNSKQTDEGKKSKNPKNTCEDNRTIAIDHKKETYRNEEVISPVTVLNTCSQPDIIEIDHNVIEGRYIQENIIENEIKGDDSEDKEKIPTEDVIEESQVSKRPKENDSAPLSSNEKYKEARKSIQERRAKFFMAPLPSSDDKISNKLTTFTTKDKKEENLNSVMVEKNEHRDDILVKEEPIVDITSVNDDLHSMESKKQEEYDIEKSQLKKDDEGGINTSPIVDESVTVGSNIMDGFGMMILSDDKESSLKKDDDENNEHALINTVTESLIIINESINEFSVDAPQGDVTIEPVAECIPPSIISNTIDNEPNEKKYDSKTSAKRKKDKKHGQEYDSDKKPKQEYDNNKKSNKDKKFTNQWDNGYSVDNYNKTFRPPSLTNIGATCYLNSAFQGISACDTFVKEVNDLCNKYPGNGVEQLHVFKELIDILNGCAAYKMEISRNQIFRNWNKPGQQDSYELLAYAMNQVYNQLRKYKEDKKDIPKRDLKRWLGEKLPMRFIIQYQIKCGCGLTTYSPLQSDLALHVTIPNDQSRCVLQNLVDLYFGNDPIEDYECDKKDCKGYNTHRIARLAKPLPHTICIHLQRTFWNGYTMKKINKDISFNQTLTLKSEYWCNEESTDDNKNDKENDVIQVPSGQIEDKEVVTKNISGEAERMVSLIENGNKEDNGTSDNAVKKSDSPNNCDENENDDSLNLIDNSVVPIAKEQSSMDHIDDTKEGNVMINEPLKESEHSVNISELTQSSQSDSSDYVSANSNEGQELNDYVDGIVKYVLSSIISDSKNEVNYESKEKLLEVEGCNEGNNETIISLNGDANKEVIKVPSEEKNDLDMIQTSTNSMEEKKVKCSVSSDHDSFLSNELISFNDKESSNDLNNHYESFMDSGLGLENILAQAQLNGHVSITPDNIKKTADEKYDKLSQIVKESTLPDIVASNVVLPVLDSSNYNQALINNSPKKETMKQIKEKIIEKDEIYDLASVIVHCGDVYGGHYTCYKRVGNRWFLTNDSSVYEVTESDVLRCQAYILFYEQPYDDIHTVE